jgi:hypothetical protein
MLYNAVLCLLLTITEGRVSLKWTGEKQLEMDKMDRPTDARR